MSASTSSRKQRSSFSLGKLNSSYLNALNKHPLLTKSITQAVLNALNEQIASYLAGNTSKISVNLGKSLKFDLCHTMTARVPLMAFYGFAINAPFAHYAYSLLNKTFTVPLSPKKKVAQILTSMATITPIISTITIIYISLIGSTSLKELLLAYKLNGIKGLKIEMKKILQSIITSLKNTLMPVIKSSWISSPIFMAVAQKYLTPNLWVVFFSFCYFVLGTYNNTQIKKAKMLQEQKKRKQQEEDERGLFDSELDVELETEIYEATEISSGESTDVEDDNKVVTLVR